jgi:tetratricopeptide (TPR) repeat protein
MMTRFARRKYTAISLAGLLLLPTLGAAPAVAVPALEGVDLNTLSGTYLAARTADSAKDIPSAAALYRSALASDPDNLFLIERALVLAAAAGEIDVAVGFAEELVAKSPTSHIAKLILAVEDIRAERYAEPASALQGPGGGVLADLVGALVAAWARFGEGEVDRAIADLRKLKGEDWYEPFKLVHVGYMALASGRTEDALNALADARKLDPNAVRITEAYARALALTGRKDEAVGALAEFLSRYPDNALARVAMEDVRSGKVQTAAVATPAKGAAEALAGIGAAVGQEGGVEVASLYLRLALYLDKETAGGLAALSLGNLLDASGQGEAAIEAFRSISPDAPFRALGSLRAALALDRLDRTAEAEAAFKEALARDPEDVQTYISYGNMLRGRERFAEAAEIYTQAVQRTADPVKADWSLFYFRGIAYERVKAWDKAEADFRKALELSPEQPLVLNYLGYSLVDMGRNLEEAMGMIRKAVELRSNDGYIVDSLGWAYYRLGRRPGNPRPPRRRLLEGREAFGSAVPVAARPRLRSRRQRARTYPEEDSRGQADRDTEGRGVRSRDPAGRLNCRRDGRSGGNTAAAVTPDL